MMITIYDEFIDFIKLPSFYKHISSYHNEDKSFLLKLTICAPLIRMLTCRIFIKVKWICMPTPHIKD